MGKYIVTTGQNLFDVALHIYGSIEGIVDLMMNNTSLSLADSLKAGDELEFTDDYIINADRVAYYRMNNITPSNGERSVYYKSSTFQKVFKIRLNNKKTSACFRISGSGTMEIDWGDNSSLQTVILENELQELQHSFDNAIAGYRKIVLYGDFSIKQADFTLLDADAIVLFRPVAIEKFILKDAKMDIGFIALFKELYDLNLCGLKTASLLPLLENKKLMRTDLSQISSQEVLDNYLIALVTQYYGRRNCTITLTRYPSGEYREPEKDENGNYRLSCGMEAVWVLCNEPAWNESGYWKFSIAGQTYTSETYS
jgi:hypothetical protein